MYSLGVVYNALPEPELQLRFEEWAKAEYPEVWAQLEKQGRKETIRGTKFSITREMKA